MRVFIVWSAPKGSVLIAVSGGESKILPPGAAKVTFSSPGELGLHAYTPAKTPEGYPYLAFAGFARASGSGTIPLLGPERHDVGAKVQVQMRRVSVPDTLPWKRASRAYVEDAKRTLRDTVPETEGIQWSYEYAPLCARSHLPAGAFIQGMPPFRPPTGFWERVLQITLERYPERSQDDAYLLGLMLCVSQAFDLYVSDVWKGESVEQFGCSIPNGADDCENSAHAFFALFESLREAGIPRVSDMCRRYDCWLVLAGIRGYSRNVREGSEYLGGHVYAALVDKRTPWLPSPLPGTPSETILLEGTAFCDPLGRSPPGSIAAMNKVVAAFPNSIAKEAAIKVPYEAASMDDPFYKMDLEIMRPGERYALVTEGKRGVPHLDFMRHPERLSLEPFPRMPEILTKEAIPREFDMAQPNTPLTASPLLSITGIPERLARAGEKTDVNVHVNVPLFLLNNADWVSRFERELGRLGGLSALEIVREEALRPGFRFSFHFRASPE